MTWQKATARRHAARDRRAEVLGRDLVWRGLPAADDAGGVVDLELVVVILEQILDAGGDVVFVDGEDEDLVVGEELSSTASEKVMTWSCSPKSASSSIEQRTALSFSAVALAHVRRRCAGWRSCRGAWRRG